MMVVGAPLLGDANESLGEILAMLWLVEKCWVEGSNFWTR